MTLKNHAVPSLLREFPEANHQANNQLPMETYAVVSLRKALQTCAKAYDPTC